MAVAYGVFANGGIRQELFGIRNPAAATIGTVMSVTRVPGTPPIECLSATIPLKCNLSPVSIIALVKK